MKTREEGMSRIGTKTTVTIEADWPRAGISTITIENALGGVAWVEVEDGSKLSTGLLDAIDAVWMNASAILYR